MREPQGVCLARISSPPPGKTATDPTPPDPAWTKTYDLANAVNSETLGRLESELTALRSLADAVNKTTLGRMESRIKEIQAGVKEER